MDKCNSKYLVNKYWMVWRRIRNRKKNLLKHTRSMISSILKGELDNIDYTKHQIFGLNMLIHVPMFHLKF